MHQKGEQSHSISIKSFIHLLFITHCVLSPWDSGALTYDGGKDPGCAPGKQTTETSIQQFSFPLQHLCRSMEIEIYFF